MGPFFSSPTAFDTALERVRSRELALDRLAREIVASQPANWHELYITLLLPATQSYMAGLLAADLPLYKRDNASFWVRLGKLESAANANDKAELVLHAEFMRDHGRCLVQVQGVGRPDPLMIPIFTFDAKGSATLVTT